MPLYWLPNAISLFRIALVAPILFLIVNGEHALALALFMLAGFSDGVDGYLAKRFDWHTRLGAMLDPVADKLLMAGTYVTLAATSLIPGWLAAAVVCRDVVIVGGATAYNFLIRPVPGEPTKISKVNTVLELLFVVFVLSRAGFEWPDPISLTLLGAAVFVTVVISGLDYVLSWSKRARHDAGT
ncbi:MAG: CDP-alcohol phosphatidyltransferase family protein [Gammaproteobacteria bacterium]|nr:CDP-alcohol phosphatidyltransferase family protein [Gammaproteobacteria bacterium]MDH4254956.1 CDP-alcohol phosphatidyltransferase family protein [Gammaproteobacteria bacterium]MDH5308855.1 CDP-alcohol phosphatidyltransferase family protein [Gammaproteobacteria bacterium]